MAENSDSAKDENFILTYHRTSKMVTCVCGKLIERAHTCLITKSGQTRVIVQTCGYESWKPKKEDECATKKEWNRRKDLIMALLNSFRNEVFLINNDEDLACELFCPIKWAGCKAYCDGIWSSDSCEKKKEWPLYDQWRVDKEKRADHGASQLIQECSLSHQQCEW